MRYNIDPLIEISHVLLPSNNSLGDEVALAWTDPFSYLLQFPEHRGSSSLNEISPLLPWFALVDGLIDRGRCREIDWKESPEDVLTAVKDLRDKYQQPAADWSGMDLLLWDDLPTEAFLQHLWFLLHRDGLALAYFDVRTDSYPLFVAKDEELSAVTRFAQESGYSRTIDFSHVDLSHYAEYPEWVEQGILPSIAAE